MPTSTDPCCCSGKQDGTGKLAGTVEAFAKLRTQVDACLAGTRLAKDRAADALAQVMIPEALDYP